MDKRFLALSLLSAGMVVSSISTAQAASTASLDVMATVVSACEIDVVPIDFGTYDGLQINTTGEVAVNCNAGVPYAVALDAGLNSDGANRLMSDGVGNMLPYRLTYTGSDWGDTGVTDTFPGDPVAGVGVGSSEAYTVEAMVFPNQTAAPGVYTDTITVTVQF